MPAIELKLLMQKVATGASLSEDEIKDAFETMMSGVASPVQMAAFLMALRVRGETIAEITGASRLMRERMLPVEAPPDAVDIVGTGGDGHNTFNVSTCAAIVAAGAGVPIAKHGNRAVSSLSGASDVLTALGVKIDVPPLVITRSIAQAGVGFMWAPMHHPAMKAWAPARAELGVRTILNLLGPLANPAGVKRQVVGVFNAAWTEPIAEALHKLGSVHAWVVHGSDGLDEITTTGPTRVTEMKNGKIHSFEVKPSDAGLPTATLADLKGGDATVNAAAIRELLAGEQGAFRDIVVLNAGAALIVGGKAATLQEGAERAARAIDDGAATRALDKLVAVTNEAA
jgi:anthranilate phosphoribosyltransferase